jgi:hypothetical protein
MNHCSEENVHSSDTHFMHSFGALKALLRQRRKMGPVPPGMATLVLIHNMIGIKWGKFLALAHSKTRKRVLK